MTYFKCLRNETNQMLIFDMIYLIDDIRWSIIVCAEVAPTPIAVARECIVFQATRKQGDCGCGLWRSGGLTLLLPVSLPTVLCARHTFAGMTTSQGIFWGTTSDSAPWETCVCGPRPYPLFIRQQLGNPCLGNDMRNKVLLWSTLRPEN